jgi:hypothetical protein
VPVRVSLDENEVSFLKAARSLYAQRTDPGADSCILHRLVFVNIDGDIRLTGLGIDVLNIVLTRECQE